MIACIRNRRGYAVWQVPVVRASKPAPGGVPRAAARA